MESGRCLFSGRSQSVSLAQMPDSADVSRSVSRLESKWVLDVGYIRKSTWASNIKTTGQICLTLSPSLSDLEPSSLAGFSRSFGSICARGCNLQIPRKLNPRGHHDWPVKRRTFHRNGYT